MKKVLLVLHGFPGLAVNDPMRKFALVNRYDAVIPDLFNSKINFSIEDLRHYIEKSLNGRKPDLIMAASMGGLIAPYIAEKYPKAKLVLIATAPNLKVGIRVYNYLIHNFNLKLIRILAELYKLLPFGIYRLFFLIFNPDRSHQKERYEEDIRENFRMLKEIPPDKMIEVVKFARKTDTSSILKRLNNKTLIISGGYDNLMPKENGSKIAKMIPNSVTLFNEDRLHYEVFDERDFAFVLNFVGQ